MQSLPLQAHRQSQKSTSTNPFHPEIVEAVLESSLETQLWEMSIEPPKADFCSLHVELRGEVCPDPLLAMAQMGEALAELPDSESHRVSFSGGAADEGLTWIGFMDLGEFVAPLEQAPRPLLNSLEAIERFITDRSSWFTSHVKETPRLHEFAKGSQQQRIQETARAIALLLQPQEQLLDVLPVRYRRKSSSLILTEQRILCLGPSLSSYNASPQLDVSLQQVAEIELAPNGMLIHQTESEHCLYFSTIDTDSLEILLSYFTRVVRRPVIPEAVYGVPQQVARAGLVASLLCAVGLTVSGTSSFLIHQVSEDASVAGSSLRADHQVSVEPITNGDGKIELPAELPPTLSQKCIEQFNAALSPHGYAALNRATKTMLIHLERFTGDYVNGFQFDQLAEAIADEVFGVCNSTVNQVRVEDGYYSFIKRQEPSSVIESNLIQKP